MDVQLKLFTDVHSHAVISHLASDRWCRHRMTRVCLPQSAIGGAPFAHGLATATGNPPNHLATDFTHQFPGPEGNGRGLVIRFPNSGGTAALLTKEAIDHAFGRQQTLVDRARDAVQGRLGSVPRIFFGEESVPCQVPMGFQN